MSEFLSSAQDSIGTKALTSKGAEDSQTPLLLSFLTCIISSLDGPVELKIPCCHNSLILVL